MNKYLRAFILSVRLSCIVVLWVGYYLRVVFYEILFLKMQFLAIMASFTFALTISPVSKVYLFIHYSWKLRSGWKLDLSQQHYYFN